jgi:Transposase domain (DUF772)/Transposase DDE domain
MSTDASRSSRNLLNTADTTLPFTSFSQYPTRAGAPSPVPPIAPPPVPPLPVPPPISERQLVERLEFDMLSRWLVGLSIGERVFDASTFSKNRRLLTHEVAQGFLSSLLGLPEVKGLLSAEPFSVDGTLLKAFASMKSFRPKDGSSAPPSLGRDCEADFRKTKRSNATHASTTDKNARLIRKGDGQESRLSYLGYALRRPQRARGGGRGDFGHGNGGTRGGGGGLERAIARGATLGADNELRRPGLRPRPEGARDRGAPGDQRDGEQERQRRARSPSKRIEECFGWGKTVCGLGQLKVRGLDKVRAVFAFAVAACNLVRLPKLLATTGELCPTA